MSTKSVQAAGSSVTGLCTDSETEGFDIEAGKTWIYPTNYPLREYQFNIVQEALFKNTLVSLPTGLGKTFIAAVIMYNYYRWYPTGKIIFMAPTRPLVTQQIQACYNIMAIPKDVTAELTGSKIQASRKDIWKEKRVFFITAQILLNDLETVENLGSKIKCVVFDEAHRAKGNYAYCQVIKKLLPENKYFRVLALSATPGSTFSDIVDVMHNLLISHIEFRTDESDDVIPYVFQRSLEPIVVPIDDKLKEIREQYISEVLEKYTRTLVRYKVIQGNCSNLTKGRIFMLQKEFQAKNKISRVEGFAERTRCLNICITLYHAFELLIRNGLRSFLSFFDDHADKPLLRGNIELQRIMDDIRRYLGPFPDIQPLPDGTTTDVPNDIRFGHPKFYKLCDILISHFTANSGNSSRVIVFCEYRESVREAYVLLLQQKPLIKPRIFIGQGGITQRQQIAIVELFKKGDCNTLISTSIGEEGLDVGDVDLIVCFDISNKSPIRMVQRMGRTGRKRSGRVVVLITEGREQQTLKECLIQKHNLSNNILNSKHLMSNKYADNPRMIPDDILPTCQKLFITVKDTIKPKTRTIKGMFDRMDSINSLALQMNKAEDIKAIEYIPPLCEYWNKKNPLSLTLNNKGCLDFSKCLERQRMLQPTFILHHSKQSEMLVSLLQYADSKRYNIPVTQMPVVSTQQTQLILQETETEAIVSSKKNKTSSKTGSFKQANLRDMFLKPVNKPSKKFASASSVSAKVIVIEDDETQKSEDIQQASCSNFVSNIAPEEDECFLCTHFFDCSRLKFRTERLDITNWVVPEMNILDQITAETLNRFAKQLSSTPKNRLSSIPEDKQEQDTQSKQSQFEKNKSFTYQLPESFHKVINKCNKSLFDDVDFTQIELKIEQQKDIRNTSIAVNVMENNAEDTLAFFKLNSLEDLFLPLNEPKNTVQHSNDISQDSDETIIYTPEKTNNKSVCSNISGDDGSPILCSYNRVKYLKKKAYRNLFGCDRNSQRQRKALNNTTFVGDKSQHLIQPRGRSVIKKPKLSNLFSRKEPSFYISSKNILEDEDDCDKDLKKRPVCNSQFKECVNDEKALDKSFPTRKTSCDTLENKTSTSPVVEETTSCIIKQQSYSDIISNIEDIFDVSILEPTCQFSDENKNVEYQNSPKSTSSISYSPCDKSDNITHQNITLKVEQQHHTQKDHSVNKENVEKSPGNSQRYLQSLLNVDDICDLSIFGISKSKTSQPNSNSVRETNIADVCDLSVFGLDEIKESSTDEIISQLNRNVSSSDLDHSLFEQPKSSEASKTVESDNTLKINERQVRNCESDVELCNSSVNNQSLLSVTQILNVVDMNNKKQNRMNLSVYSKEKKNIDETDIDDSENDLFDTAQTNKVRKKYCKLGLSTLKKTVTGSCTKNTKFDSDDDFETPFTSKKRLKSISKTKKTGHFKEKQSKNKSQEPKKVKVNPFIELEAQVSEDECGTISEDERETDADCSFDSSFVNDETQFFVNNTQMHAHYLQSVRSPSISRGKFKIPIRKRTGNTQVYSQIVDMQDDTYLNDSFCVGSQNPLPDESELSELEVAELLLQEEKKRKKQIKNNKSKRKKIFCISDDSD